MLKSTSLDTTRIRNTVTQLIAKHHPPGIAIGVVSGDDLVYAEGFGLADIESEAPMTPEHRQRIASITKTMVGLSAMALVDEGRLHLEDRVVDLLPDIPLQGHGDSLTVWHLLTHTGGIGEAPTVKDIGDPFRLLFTNEAVPDNLVDGYPEGITIETPPGTKWAYANHGYFLLGEIASRIEKSPIPDVVHARIFEPLGMSNSDMLDRPHPDLSTGYHRAPGEDERELLLRVGREIPQEETVDGDNIRSGEYPKEWGRGAAGGVQSTIPDMARYASALLRKGAGIVRPETFDQMVSPQWQSDPRLPAWGLGFGVRSYSRRRFGHGGSAFGGWNSNLAVFPDENLAVLVHMNLVYDRFDSAVRSRILEAVLGDSAPTFAEASIAPAILSSAPGVYEAPTPGPLTNFRVVTGCGRIQISVREGGLVLHARRGPWKSGVRMLPIDPAEPDLFLLDTGDPDPPRIVAISDPDGRVTALHFAASTLWTMHRNDKIPSWA